MAVELTPRGPFSLGQSLAFAEGFYYADVHSEDGQFSGALCDDDGTPAAFVVRDEGGAVVVEHDGALSDERLGAHVARILSLDVDGRGLDEVTARDAIARSAVRQFPGRRPVCFPTPFEAAVFGVLSQRTSRRQAAGVKRRFTAELGTEVSVAGRTERAFPSPAAIASAGELPGVGGAQKADRLRGLAEAATEGALDPALLRGFPTPEEALEHLEGIPGIGPFGALLVLTRGAGHPDVAPPTTIRPAREALAAAAGVSPDELDAQRAAAIAEPWRPFRSWIFFLLRNRADT